MLRNHSTPGSQGPEGTAASGALRAAGIVFLLLGLFVIGSGISGTPLFDPDEGRNAEVAREMAESDDFVVPHLNGLPYLDKPILLFASTAIVMKALGPTETAARLPPLLFTLATVALTIAYGRRVYDRDTAVLAGVILLTSPLVMAFAKVAIFDALMMFWVTLSLTAVHRRLDGGGRGWAALAGAAAGVAVLTKGPVGLVIPVLVVPAYAAFCRRSLRSLAHPIVALAFVVVTGPWVFAMISRHPEFPHYAVVRETLQRVATGRMNRGGPVYYFVVLLAAGALPWTLVPIAGAGELRRRWAARREPGGTDTYLMTWIAVPWLLFTLSQSKRPGYILPVFPALALLIARLFLRDPAIRRRAATWGAVTCGALAAALLVGRGRLASAIDEGYEALAGSIPATGLVLALGLALPALLAWRSRAKASPAAVASAFALVPLMLITAANRVLPPWAAARSSRELARTLDAAAPGVTVVSVSTLSPSLTFYLGRPILLDTAGARETGSNYAAEYAGALRAAEGSTLRPAGWWRERLATCDEPTVFVVERRRERHVHTLEGRLPRIAVSRMHAAYGPCRSP